MASPRGPELQGVLQVWSMSGSIRSPGRLAAEAGTRLPTLQKMAQTERYGGSVQYDLHMYQAVSQSVNSRLECSQTSAAGRAADLLHMVISSISHVPSSRG